MMGFSGSLHYIKRKSLEIPFHSQTMRGNDRIECFGFDKKWIHFFGIQFCNFSNMLLDLLYTTITFSEALKALKSDLTKEVIYIVRKQNSQKTKKRRTNNFWLNRTQTYSFELSCSLLTQLKTSHFVCPG